MIQTKALNILKSGKNVFLTGSAGAGKTYVLNQYIKYLRERKVSVAITASTGIAATHMNGQTIHSWSGIGVKEKLNSNDLANLMDKKYLYDKLVGVKVLLIDEISMLHKNQLDLVDQVLQFFKGNKLPFGGIQVVFSGDFFQLPPIGNSYESNKEKFAFMSKSWLDAGLNVCYLTEQHRQKDQDLNTILNEIRMGNVSDRSKELLLKSSTQALDSTKNITQLYTHNQNVDNINQHFLDKIKHKSEKFKAKTKGNPTMLEGFKKSILAEDQLELKNGSKVMFVKNNYEKNYMNGTLGEVISFNEKGFPVVKTTDKTIVAEPETWQVEDDKGKVLVSFQQVPLRLAWAITVHKSQGMTLDAAEIDLSKTFERGQGYVALSRVKDLNGLRLIGYNDVALAVDELALRADKRFRELSHIIENELSDTVLEKQFNPFIELCDGITNLDEIIKHEKKIKEKAEPKKPTLTITKELVEKGLNLAAIAQERGLSETTIISHLVRLRELNPTLNLNNMKPDENLVEMIQKSYKKLNASKNQGEAVGRKQIFEDLKGEIDYTSINLALLFII